MKINEIKNILRSIALKYPENIRQSQLKDLDRIAFHIQLILEHKGKDIKICDIGGGIGLFSTGCAALGMKSTFIDDFKDEINIKVGNSVLEIHRSYGVEIISKDVIKDTPNLTSNYYDAITSFDSMEHWHHSPKKLFKSVKSALKNNGLFVLGVPNCVNLRKRITVPIGYGKWSDIKEWYESETFRGHVREPDVDDLIYIARDMNLRKIKILGHNWLGYKNNKRIIRFITPIFSTLLRLNPRLCSDIYLLGYKNSD